MWFARVRYPWYTLPPWIPYPSPKYPPQDTLPPRYPPLDTLPTGSPTSRYSTQLIPYPTPPHTVAPGKDMGPEIPYSPYEQIDRCQ